MLIDTHCHIHESDYPLPIEDVIERAKQAGVEKIICVGTDEASSRAALEAAAKYDEIFATIGAHPYYADQDIAWMSEILAEHPDKLVAIGEIGLDYHDNLLPHTKQIEFLEKQIDLAVKYDLPISFHVREAYSDFWPVLDNFEEVRGVLHCFTDSQTNAEEGLKRGFYFAINGISTFTRDEAQQTMFRNLPLERLMLETDAPFLTPKPLRGRVKANEPAFIREVAEYSSKVRGISFDRLADITTDNAKTLFNL